MDIMDDSLEDGIDGIPDDSMDSIDIDIDSAPIDDAEPSSGEVVGTHAPEESIYGRDDEGAVVDGSTGAGSSDPSTFETLPLTFQPEASPPASSAMRPPDVTEHWSSEHYLEARIKYLQYPFCTN